MHVRDYRLFDSLKRLLLLLLSRLYIVRDIRTKFFSLIALYNMQTNQFIRPSPECARAHIERPRILVRASKVP